MLKVLMCSSEVEPFAKTGGLGDVLGALPRALSAQGIEVFVVLPKYKIIPQDFVSKMTLKKYVYVNLGWRRQYCGLFEYVEDGVTYIFIDNEYYFGVDSIYTNTDLERFCFFEKCVISLLCDEDYKFDVVHCHDWQTGLIPVMVKAMNIPVKTVYTIHNLQYQGIFAWDIVKDFLGIPDEYFDKGYIEFYGAVNFMKGGISFADKVTTVSETYAEEIKYPFFGEKLDGLIQQRGDVAGILNGINYDLYNPAKSPYIFQNYDAKTFVQGKAENKRLLQEQLGLEQNPDAALIGMVGRLSGQKGLELVEHVFDDIMRQPVQLAILGTGDPHYENLFRYYDWERHSTVSASVMFDNALAHKIYAASDMFLMPSLYEPCGLGQLIALSYGSIPIVREVGGLKDTITPYNTETKEGNGFTFYSYNAHDMLFAIERAVQLYADKNVWNGLVEKAMSCNFSWEKSAKKYAALYEEALKEPEPVVEIESEPEFEPEQPQPEVSAKVRAMELEYAHVFEDGETPTDDPNKPTKKKTAGKRLK